MLGEFVELWAAGVADVEDDGCFVVGFADGVVDGGADEGQVGGGLHLIDAGVSA